MGLAAADDDPVRPALHDAQVGVRVALGPLLGGHEGAVALDVGLSHGQGQVAFGAALAASGVLWGSLAAVAAQVSTSARVARGVAFGTLGTTFALRAGGDVFAAGDIANAEHPFYGRRVRVEHWANALNQGPAAARAMLGRTEPFERLPYFFSDQYDVGMEYSGLADPEARIVVRGDLAAREAVVFWLGDDGAVMAGMNINVWDVNEHVQALIRSRAAVAPDRLADHDVPLEGLTG